MRVLVVTPIRLYRDGVADALRRLTDVEDVATAATGPAAVVEARRSECDVALLDMMLKDSTLTIEALLTTRPVLKVVALGVPEDGPEVVACAEAGISGYVSREATLAEVGEGLRGALRGEPPISGRVAAGLMRHIALQARARGAHDLPAHLTQRERQVLTLLEEGLTNRQIARALDLQLSTVKNHVHQVLAKYGVAGRGDVIRLVEKVSATSD